MARVPVIQDSAQLQVGEGRRRVQADADSLGGQEARALAGVAQSVDRVAVIARQKRDEFDEAEALEALNSFERDASERLMNTESGYLSTTRERAAIDQRSQVEADIDRLAVTRAESISNPRARQMFERTAQRRAAGFIGQVATHAAQENNRYLDRQLQVEQSQATEQAVALAHDPVAVAEQFSRMGASLERRRRMHGWTDEEYAEISGAARSDFYGGVITALAADDPNMAQALYQSVAGDLRSDDRVQLYGAMRAAIRAGEDAVIDEAWTFVAEGRRIPSDVWGRVPGRARIDIQNELRRRAEGGASESAGDRDLIDFLDILPDADFAQADLWSVRGALGNQFRRMAERQRGIRDGSQSADVTRQRSTFNALRDIAETTLGMDFSPGERAGTGAQRRANAFNAALLREVEAFSTANPGASIDAETSQILIGRAWVSMRGDDTSREQGRVRGDRGRAGQRNGQRGSAVTARTEVVVPFAQIPPDTRAQFTQRLERRLGRIPTQGEVENAYASFLSGQQISVGGGE